MAEGNGEGSVINIDYLWFVMHQPEGPESPMQCIIGGEPDASHEKFGILIADLIRHVARAKCVDESDVLEWVDHEIYHPTTDLRRIGPN